ncbi:hypothetical protein [Acidiphilium sp.]|uniref:hypothetical protein n=1 Tax=Acidiphilium sp. TaxID=527 RepID=UPI003D049D63
MTFDQTKSSENGHRWTEDEDRILYEGFLLNEKPRIISVRCGRSLTAIRRRMIRLDLIDANGVRNNDPPLFDEIRARFHGGGTAAAVEPAKETNC